MVTFISSCQFFQFLIDCTEITKSYQLSCVLSSGIARLGHTGARALATRGHAPPVQVCGKLLVLIIALSIVNQVLNCLEIEQHSIV